MDGAFSFLITSFSRLLGEGTVKGPMMAQDDNKILSVALHILHTSYDHGLRHKFVKR